ncbi:MAG: DUF4957 domain-containing protein [Dysgonamonadaceae bacterium]|jgi:hypothetical protein|nr:DUF4957 domain-containing protein [Dysgonamonadaceae bacterium]
MKQKLKKGCMLLLYAAMFFFVSCIDGYKDETSWSSSVQNAQLESPSAESIKIIKGDEKMTVSWPVVYGAGGYQFSCYIVDDPDNPVVVGEENEVVDDCSVERALAEDTKYKIVIKTLGNPKYNNKDALTTTEVAWDNMLTIYAKIPAGTNLTDYFTANPVPQDSINTELGYELEAGGDYTMNGNVSTGKVQVTIKGDKVAHPAITMTDGSFVCGNGFTLKFIDIDYSNFAGANTNSIILMDPVFPTEGLTQSGYAVIPSGVPIAIKSCKITGLKYYLFYDSDKYYALSSFLIKDCIIGQNTNEFSQALIRFSKGMVKDWTVTDCTFYNEKAPSHSSNRLCQISTGNIGSVKPLNELWANGSMTVTNCTFWQAGKTAQSFNSNGAFGGAADKVTVSKCVFVDSYENGRIISRFRRGTTSATFTGGDNSQWYGGQLFTGSQDVTADVGYLTSDPQLTYLGNGEFKMEGAEQISKRTGDPRWLPAQ